MDKKKWGLAILLITGMMACNNAGKNKNSSDVLKANADSLYKQVIKEHNEGMGGWMKIEDRELQIRDLIDSIDKLPVKAQSSLDALKTKLREVKTELGVAYEEMDTWMSAMNLDSAANDLKQRINYLVEQSEKAKMVNALITSSLQKADSLLRVKF